MCKKKFEKQLSQIRGGNHFCSHSCSAKYNNPLKREDRFCLYCSNLIESANKNYCSRPCGIDYRYNETINKWKNGEISGATKYSISGTIRKYIFRKYQNKCSICSWAEINLVSGKRPLQIDHIDGNSENNVEENLRLLCPNCHSLTPTFGALNKGHGRKWRY
jgi:hypothetical protein